MFLIHSQYIADFDNRPMNPSSVQKIKLSPASLRNVHLWILRFYGTEEKVLRSWFYNTDQERKDDLEGVVKDNPQIEIYQL